MHRCSWCNLGVISSLSHPSHLREGEEVIFTYDVQFRLSDKEWATRWEDFFNSGETRSLECALVKALPISIWKHH